MKPLVDTFCCYSEILSPHFGEPTIKYTHFGKYSVKHISELAWIYTGTFLLKVNRVTLTILGTYCDIVRNPLRNLLRKHPTIRKKSRIYIASLYRLSYYYTINFAVFITPDPHWIMQPGSRPLFLHLHRTERHVMAFKGTLYAKEGGM